MKKTPALLLFSIGLALAIAGPASAQVDNLYPRSGTASPTFNDRLETSALAGLGGFPNNSGVNAVPGPANQAHDSATTMFNAGSAALAGTFLLLLWQQRNRNNTVLKH